MANQPTLLPTDSFLVPNIAPFPVLTIKATAPSKREGSPNAATGAAALTAFTFTVTRTNIPLEGSVNWSVVHGSTSANDFSGSTSGTLDFLPTETTKTITVYVIGDFLAEADETFSVQLSNPRGANLGTASVATVTIANDDVPRLSIAAGAASLPEGTITTGTTPRTFTVTRDVGLGVSTVKWAVLHRGTNAQDFSGPITGTLSFAAGETTKVITLQVLAEAVVESDETFVVQLSAPTNAVLVTTSAAATATITNDDAHTLSIAAASAVKKEGHAGMTPLTFTVTRSAGIGSSTVNWNVAHGTTSDADFSGATRGTLTFNGGETSKTITVNAVGDKVIENAENFDIQLTAPSNAAIINASASGTLLNDDLPTLSIAADQASQIEGNSGATLVTFTVKRDTDLGLSSADWVLQHTSTNAADFSGPTKGSVIFMPGQTTRSVQIQVSADTAIELDETFAVQLSAPDGAVLGVSSATAMIRNDDLPLLSIATSTPSLQERHTGTTPVSFTITRSDKIGSSSVAWAVVHGSTDASDFSGPTSGTVTFANNETSKTITVKVAGDKVLESDETFSVQLSAPIGARILTAAAPVTLLNDEPVSSRLRITASTPSQAEGTLTTGSTRFTFTVTRTDGTGASSVDWAVKHGTTQGDDFTGPTSGIVAFANGETTKMITVNVAGDTAIEAAETFSIQLANSVGSVIETASASATLVNDDLPTIKLASSQIWTAEGGAIGYTFTRSAGIGQSTFDYRIETSEALAALPRADIFAAYGFDLNRFTPEEAPLVPGYTDLLLASTASADDFTGNLSGQVTFNEGETSKTITIGTVNDTLPEVNQLFRLYLDHAQGATFDLGSLPNAPDSPNFYAGLHANGTAPWFRGGIWNDDGSTLRIVADKISQPEGNSGITPFNFTVTRSSTTGPKAVLWGLYGNTESSDFIGASRGFIYFADGEASKTLTINVNGDTGQEGDEQFNVVVHDSLFGDGDGEVGGAVASSTILEDDTPVPDLATLSLTATNATRTEGHSGTTPFTFTVTRSHGIGESSVDYTINPFAATADDFASDTLFSGHVQFANGETAQTITVNVQGDTLAEGDEMFLVHLRGPVNATIETPSATGIILNDDTGGQENAVSSPNFTVSPGISTSLAGYWGTTAEQTLLVNTGSSPAYGGLGMTTLMPPWLGSAATDLPPTITSP